MPIPKRFPPLEPYDRVNLRNERTTILGVVVGFVSERGFPLNNFHSFEFIKSFSNSLMIYPWVGGWGRVMFFIPAGDRKTSKGHVARCHAV